MLHMLRKWQYFLKKLLILFCDVFRTLAISFSKMIIFPIISHLFSYIKLISEYSLSFYQFQIWHFNIIGVCYIFPLNINWLVKHYFPFSPIISRFSFLIAFYTVAPLNFIHIFLSSYSYKFFHITIDSKWLPVFSIIFLFTIALLENF